ncbi:MAG: hypothetical protein Q9222_004811 [Ikaeria aurantiellina]
MNLPWSHEELEAAFLLRELGCKTSEIVYRLNLRFEGDRSRYAVSNRLRRLSKQSNDLNDKWELATIRDKLTTLCQHLQKALIYEGSKVWYEEELVAIAILGQIGIDPKLMQKQFRREFKHKQDIPLQIERMSRRSSISHYIWVAPYQIPTAFANRTWTTMDAKRMAQRYLQPQVRDVGQGMGSHDVCVSPDSFPSQQTQHTESQNHELSIDSLVPDPATHDYGSQLTRFSTDVEPQAEAGRESAWNDLGFSMDYQPLYQANQDPHLQLMDFSTDFGLQAQMAQGSGLNGAGPSTDSQPLNQANQHVEELNQRMSTDSLH